MTTLALIMKLKFLTCAYCTCLVVLSFIATCAAQGEFINQSRAVVGGPAGQAMAGPVLGLTKQYIELEIVINLSNYIANYASNLLVHCLEFYFTLSYDKSQFFRLWNPFI